MIRINLLPIKAAKRRSAGQKQVLLGAVVVVGAMAGVVLLHGYVSADLDVQQSQIN